jgi:putative membrane protein
MRKAFRLMGVAILINLLSSSVSHAHPSGLQSGDAWWLAWHFDLLVTTNLFLLGGAYSLGLARVWSRAGVGRVVSRWRAVSFGMGIVALTVALLSPLDTLSDDLSWVHMTQHMVLMVFAAPLIIAGSPGLTLTWALPVAWRKQMGRFSVSINSGACPIFRFLLWNPFFIWVMHAVVLWVWHLPVLYELALNDPLVHDLEHLTFFIAACLFWRVAVDARLQPTLSPIASVLYLFTTSLHAMLLGILMTLSPSVWYASYTGRTERWNLSPLEDQQLAGAIMWMPACTVYAIIAAVLFAAWLNQLEPPYSPRRRKAHSPAIRIQSDS